MFRPRRSRSLFNTRRSRSIIRQITNPRRSTKIRIPGLSTPNFRPASLNKLLFPRRSTLRGLFWKIIKVSFRDKFNGSPYIVDGDTIRVGDASIRLHGIDAPEMGQMAQRIDGKWYDQGEFVKEELMQFISGRSVQVEVISKDKYRRTVGIVKCDGIDVNSWLVEKGYAISAYGDTYKHAERRARRAKIGIWGDKISFHPGGWRKKASKARTL